MVVDFINTLFQNDMLRDLILTFTAVFAGYTLQPVPDWLDNIFNNSNVFKYTILFLFGCGLLHPLNTTSLLIVIITPAIMLYAFHLLREPVSKTPVITRAVL